MSYYSIDLILETIKIKKSLYHKSLIKLSPYFLKNLWFNCFAYYINKILNEINIFTKTFIHFKYLGELNKHDLPFMSVI